MTKAAVGWCGVAFAATVPVVLLNWAVEDRAAGPDLAKDPAVRHVDLQPKANQKLREPFAGGRAGNTLAELKQGRQTLEGSQFNIGEGFILLAGNRLQAELPQRVDGIPVHARFGTLHILHATAYSVADDTVIAQYVVHYEDKSRETIPVVYGKDVRDWWCHDGDEEPTRGKIAWTGSNELTASAGGSLWLFCSTWKNPKPNQKVAAIDCVSMLTDAAPFVVAMSHTE
jgi:hypothetical protein